MECNLSSSNDEDFVLEFSDDECNDRIDQVDNYDEKKTIWRDSKWCDSSQVMHDYTQLKLENCSDFKDLKLKEFQEKKHQFLWEHSALSKHSPEKLQETSTNMEKDEMVNIPKLIHQLLNAKVVIEKLCESSETISLSETKSVLPNESRFRNSIQRYCAKCKTLKADKFGISVKKSCPKCETALKYVCCKCNKKQYLDYQTFKVHWKQCEGAVDTCKKLSEEYATASQKLNPTDFLVEKTKIDYSRVVIRYCLRCNEIKENYSKWQHRVCRKCGQDLLYQCNKCKAHYISSRALRDHMQTKCYSSQYKCNECDFTNPLWDRMSRHIQNVHFGTKVHCPKCDIIMKNEACLRTHLGFCGSEPKFNCHCCAFKTKYKYSLQKHIKTIHGKY